MGIFSKKTYLCEKCGKEFQKRINLNGNVCDDCRKQEENVLHELIRLVGGYIDYYNDVFSDTYTLEEMKKIAAHREGLIAKFQNSGGIKKTELMIASENYKNLTDAEAADILIRNKQHPKKYDLH